MSEVNLQFTVNSFSSTMTVATNQMVVNPVSTDLTVFAGFAAFPPQGGAGNGQVIFNNAGLFESNMAFTFNSAIGSLGVPSINVGSINATGNLIVGNVTSTGNLSLFGNVDAKSINLSNGGNLGAITDLRIAGGSDGQYLRTDGNGIISFQTLAALGPTGSLQFNNGNLIDGIPNVTYSGGNLNLGNSNTVKLTGGTNGYVLQTDGTGNLTWMPQAGNILPGNGIPGGANSQVQFNNAGIFGGDPGFTYDKNSDTLSVANLSVTGSVIGSLTGNAIFDTLSVNGTTQIQQGFEKASIQTAALTGNVDWNILDGAVQFYTVSSTGNSIINFRGNSIVTFDNAVPTGKSVTVALLSTMGVGRYWPTSIKIDGTAQTVKYIDSAAPSNSSLYANSIACFNYTFIKTATNAFTVLGSFNSFI